MRWKPVVVKFERSDGSLVVAVGHPRRVRIRSAEAVTLDRAIVLVRHSRQLLRYRIAWFTCPAWPTVGVDSICVAC
jgi:hypothetical protein